MTHNQSLETIEEFLARGGKITQYKPGPEKFDTSVKYRKDRQLKALNLLKKQVLDPDDIKKIENAIMIRIEILKATF